MYEKSRKVRNGRPEIRNLRKKRNMHLLFITASTKKKWTYGVTMVRAAFAASNSQARKV